MSDLNGKNEDVLAGEYVLGTMQGDEREQFEQKLQLDARLRKKVNDWENRFYPMLEGVESVAPPDNVWDVIENRINPADRIERSGFWNSLVFWRNFGLVTATLLIALSLQVFLPDQEPVSADRIMVVLNDQARAGWVVSARHENSLQVQAVQPSALPPGQICQLWIQTADNRLLPVGVLPHTGVKILKLPMTIPADARYKVSIEALDELPVNEPKGKIVFEGELVSI